MESSLPDVRGFALTRQCRTAASIKGGGERASQPRTAQPLVKTIFGATVIDRRDAGCRLLVRHRHVRIRPATALAFMFAMVREHGARIRPRTAYRPTRQTL